MHVQILNFQLKDMTAADYQKVCDQLAPTFAGLDGLVSKVWLASEETNTYGGIYTWRDRQAMEGYIQSELFQTVAEHPNLTNITSKDFAVLESPTRTTRGLVEVTT